MTTNILIRLAVPADALKFPDIERSAAHLFCSVEGLEWIADSHVMQPDDHFAAIAAHTAWVAYETAHDASNVIAFLNAAYGDDALHICEVSVHARAMGNGIGRRLIDTAVADARRRGVAAVTLTTFRDVTWNELYYQRLGFETLAPNDLDQSLTAILDDEVAAGLPRDRRCAMRLTLAPHSSQG